MKSEGAVQRRNQSIVPVTKQGSDGWEARNEA